jgi:NitT/TauT family transport system ATP-binding protein
VFENLNFEVRDREITSIIGPSGCGKTTLLSLIAGLRRPSRGVILIDGEVSKEIPNVGLVFQDYDKILMPWRSVLQNVELGLELKGVPSEDRRRVAIDAIQVVGLGGFENSYPYHLSGGMRQRVQIARILAYNPDFLLLDEPFGSLDSQTKTTLQIEFLNLWNQNPKTVILVTHDVSEAVYMSDRIIAMSNCPAKIISDICVNLPRPRPDIQSLQDDNSEFKDARRYVWNILREQIRKSVAM